jgi:hypothetical protein
MGKIKKGVYEHYSGRRYDVIGVAKHSETLSEMVVYRPLYETDKQFKDYLWVRPIKMFLDEAKVQGKKVKRFKYIGGKNV